MTLSGKSAKRQVLVIGWDGATLDLARPWMAKGLLPNLQRLANAGAQGSLNSTDPPISAPAWSSFMTGTNPGKHGIYHFQAHVDGTYRERLVSGADVAMPTLWGIVSSHGGRVAAINVAMTYPPEQVNGIVISGVDSPGTRSGYTWPAELAQDLRSRIGEYTIEPGVIEHVRRGRHELALTSILDALEQRVRSVEWLLQRERWDLFVVNYRASDNVQHHFWHFMDATHPLHDTEADERLKRAILHTYQRLDEHLGWVLDQTGPDCTVIVLSDHGFGPTSSRAVYLNRWLAKEGYLLFAGGTDRDMGLDGRIRRAMWGVVWGPLRKYSSKWAKDTLRRLAPALYDRARTPASYASIDWSRTKAYSDEYRPVIWINMQGREPQGTVEPGAQYEALRSELIERLLALRDPVDNEAVVERATRREELYSGAQVKNAPDIMLTLRQEPYVRSRLSHTTSSTEPVQVLSAEQLKADYLPQGLHRQKGMLFMAGSGIRAGCHICDAHIMDVAPTILHLMGWPVPASMDGRVLEDVLADGRPVTIGEELAQRGNRAEQAYHDDDESLVREKLEGLGYLG